MSETFVPLVPVKAASTDSAFNVLQSNGQAPRGVPTAPGAPRTADANGSGSAAEACAKPVITLQREGDVVSAIRIQCGCGQVIDLTCVY